MSFSFLSIYHIYIYIYIYMYAAVGPPVRMELEAPNKKEPR